jgi:hypothetical protein
MLLPPFVPPLDPLLKDFKMFRVRHGRVTSLASALLPMIWVWLKATLYATVTD